MDILKSINDHLKLQSKCLELSTKILENCQSDNLDNMLSMTENRERLLSTLTYIFQNIDRHLNLLPPESITADLIPSLKEWHSKMINLSHAITLIDEEILACLEASKDSVAMEISKLFKQKENLKGYDLSNVKR